MTPQRERELENALSFGIGAGLAIVLLVFLLLADLAWQHCTLDFSSTQCGKNGAAALVVLTVLIFMIAVLGKILSKQRKGGKL